MIGWPFSLPMSLAEATSEPVKVTEPTITSTTMKKMSQPSSAASEPSRACWPLSRTKLSIASSAAAPPPTALKSETSCGMAVMATERAIHRPAAPPTTRPPTMMSQLPIDGFDELTKINSAVTAMNIPMAERRLPPRAVAGEFIRWRPSAKNDAPIRNANCTKYPRFAVVMAGTSSFG